MKKNTLVLMMFLLFAAFATATVSADEHVLGTFTAEGYGPNATVAFQNAQYVISQHVAAVQAELQEGDLASYAIIEGNWDGTVYHITYNIFVSSMPPI